MTDIKQLELDVSRIVAQMHQLTCELQVKLIEIRDYKIDIPKPIKQIPPKLPLEKLGNRYIRINELSKIIGVCHSTIWRWIQLDKFPKGHKLGERTTAWLGSDIDEWMEKQ